MGIHNFYLQLRPFERDVCDKMAQGCFDVAARHGIPADGADPAERMTEGIARWIVESRSLPQRPPASTPRGAQQVVDFEGIGLCFFSHQGMRPPVKGEFYLSGAIVRAYRAPSDLSTPYQVVKPTVRAVRQRSTNWPYVAGEPLDAG